MSDIQINSSQIIAPQFNESSLVSRDNARPNRLQQQRIDESELPIELQDAKYVPNQSLLGEHRPNVKNMPKIHQMQIQTAVHREKWQHIINGEIQHEKQMEREKIEDILEDAHDKRLTAEFKQSNDQRVLDYAKLEKRYNADTENQRSQLWYLKERKIRNLNRLQKERFNTISQLKSKQSELLQIQKDNKTMISEMDGEQKIAIEKRKLEISKIGKNLNELNNQIDWCKQDEFDKKYLINQNELEQEQLIHADQVKKIQMIEAEQKIKENSKKNIQEKRKIIIEEETEFYKITDQLHGKFVNHKTSLNQKTSKLIENLSQRNQAIQIVAELEFDIEFRKLETNRRILLISNVDTQILNWLKINGQEGDSIPQAVGLRRGRLLLEKQELEIKYGKYQKIQNLQNMKEKLYIKDERKFKNKMDKTHSQLLQKEIENKILPQTDIQQLIINEQKYEIERAQFHHQIQEYESDVRKLQTNKKRRIEFVRKLQDLEQTREQIEKEISQCDEVNLNENDEGNRILDMVCDQMQLDKAFVQKIKIAINYKLEFDMSKCLVVVLSALFVAWCVL